MGTDDFFERVDDPGLRSIDRVVYLLWFIGKDDRSRGATARDLCDVIERHGHAKQNITRLRSSLSKDKRVVRAGQDMWRLSPGGRNQLNESLGSVLDLPKKAAATDSVLPQTLFTASRGYIKKVVHQLNASFDHGLYDCCAVMCRRLVETLLIEVYEAKGRAAEIKGQDNHFLMLNGLVSFFENDQAMHASRNAVEGLRGVKRLGDLSAHNRRWNAQKNDIDKIRDGLRVVVGELLEMAELANAA